MRVGRVDIDGAPHAAIFDSDGETVRILSSEIDVIEVLKSGGEPSRSVIAESLLSAVRMLAPVAPPSIRDFSVFEQHIEGIMLGLGTPVPRGLVRLSVLLLLQPRGGQRTGRETSKFRRAVTIST